MTLGSLIPRRVPRRAWDEGATAVEAALIIGVLVFLIFGIIEFGTALWNWNTMVLAVGDAGRYVMVNTTCDPITNTCTLGCNTTCAVNQMQSTLATAPGQVSATCSTPTDGQICLSANTTAGTPSTMTLTAAYGFKVIGLSPTYTLTSQGTFPLD
jgi:Flp pilus assembly protein TadG